MTAKPLLTRRAALTGTAATLAAARAALPSGAFAAGPGPETSKARRTAAPCLPCEYVKTGWNSESTRPSTPIIVSMQAVDHDSDDLSSRAPQAFDG